MSRSPDARDTQRLVSRSDPGDLWGDLVHGFLKKQGLESGGHPVDRDNWEPWLPVVGGWWFSESYVELQLGMTMPPREMVMLHDPEEHDIYDGDPKKYAVEHTYRDMLIDSDYYAPALDAEEDTRTWVDYVETVPLTEHNVSRLLGSDGIPPKWTEKLVRGLDRVEGPTPTDPDSPTGPGQSSA